MKWQGIRQSVLNRRCQSVVKKRCFVEVKEGSFKSHVQRLNKQTVPTESKDTTITKNNNILQHLTDSSWRSALKDEFSKPYFQKILEFLDHEKQQGKIIYPPENEIFNAFNHTPLNKVEVVIIGQDPYHGKGQAQGLSFSVKRGVAVPPSLQNIYKELSKDIEGFKNPGHGDLMSWAEQGVMLLNASYEVLQSQLTRYRLTVEAGKPNSHSKIGWDHFTDAAIKALNDHQKGLVFILFGVFAQKKGSIVDPNRHFVLKAAHPSPYSADRFFGCKVFSKTNEILKNQGKHEIDWKLTN